MRNLAERRGIGGEIAAVVVAAVSLFSFWGGGCAHDSVPAADPELAAPFSPTSLEDIINSESYAGNLVVHFDENLVVRQDASKTLYSMAGQDDVLNSVKAAIAAVPKAQLLRSISVSEKKADAQRQKLERLSGQRLTDWNSIYHIKTETPDDAIKLLKELRGQPGVAKIYPAVRGYPASILETPDLSGSQDYLRPEATHGGLNAEAAWEWATGPVMGNEIYVVDNEYGTNFDHEDLNLSATDLDVGGNFLYTPVCAPGFPPPLGVDCSPSIAHGVAVAGVLVAQHNDHGVKGFAPQAHYVHATMIGGTYGDLAGTTDGVDNPLNPHDNDIEPGAVWLIEVQLPGPGAVSCSEGVEGQLGCVPTEMWPEDFAAIQQATAYGVTVVNGAGNGSTDLNNPDLYTAGGEGWDFLHNLAVEDAGSIMVGASEGANEQWAVWSNCGSRVNAFAWGLGVATTGYPYGSYAWNNAVPPVPGNDPADPNNFYIDNFGGTSSATAMVGGAAVLVQSFARAEFGNRRYLMPAKMRELIVTTGQSQADGGCNIGKQPRIDLALAAADAFVTQTKIDYPQLVTGVRLTGPEMVALRALGVGIICKEFDPVASDPICPETEIYPPGSGMAKTLDFDGDGRADLVRWTNGTWRLDLSGQGPNADHFGEWDIEIDHAPLPGQWVWPYVADMNSDSRTDFVVYDKGEGKFYIALTDLPLLTDGTWHGWDAVIDYSADWHDDLNLNPWLSHYSRPAIGDYNNDGWNDIGIACSDGFWRIDFGGASLASLGAFDVSPQYLSPEMLAAAPGWAYLPFVYDEYQHLNGVLLGFKMPDGHPDEGRIVIAMYIAPLVDLFVDEELGIAVPHIFGGNDQIPLAGQIEAYDSAPTITLKDGSGNWLLSSFNVDTYHSVYAEIPDGVYGRNECHPVIANFDGDNKEDRAVMCPDGWEIAYSDESYAPLLSDGIRNIPLGYDTATLSLPGRSYSGGISYAYAQQLIQFFQLTHPGVPPPILIDMVTFH